MSDPELTPAGALGGPVDRARALSRAPGLTLAALRTVRAAAPRTLLVCMVLQVLAAVLLGGQILVLKHLVTGLLGLADSHEAAKTIAPELAALAVVTLLGGVATAALALEQRLLGEIVARETMDEIIDVAAAVDLVRFEDPTFYDHLERATAAGTFRPTQIVNSLMTLLLSVFTSIGVAVALFTLEPLLLPFILAASIPVLLATLYNSRQTYAFEYGMTTHARERLHLLELFTARETAKELRVFQAIGFLRERYDALSDERIDRMRSFLRGRLRVAVLGNVASALGMTLAVASVGWLLATGRASVATTTTAVMAMVILAGRLSSVTSSLGTLVESGMFLDDLRTFLTQRPERPVVTQPADAVPARLRRLEVDRLSFAYPDVGRPVISDISLTIEPGEVVALVGENGSGKTTLVKLLCGLYAPDGGSIRWDGREASAMDPDELRSGMTVLFQDFVQYHLTAADNIALGRSTVARDQRQVEEAARRSGIHEAIASLPRGYETRLGRQFYGGHELSGGQWQRLALARAFYRGGDFLIMDEPTAALDPRAEFQLFEQMRSLAAGKSVLLISHRFANVRVADRIYVLDSGRMVESGTHDELMTLDGLYATLFRLQAAAYVTS